MFHSARIKLTFWYLVIIMAISLLFSVIIYALVNEEFLRFEHMQKRAEDNFQRKYVKPIPNKDGHNIIIFTQDDQDAIAQARLRLVTALGIVNLTILMGAGAAGYFLAGRTLGPIKTMLDEQKRFVSDSSHEFRTPLTSLRSEIEVGLRNKNLATPTAKKILESNLEEVISLQILSDNLLELAQNGKLVNKSSIKPVSIKIIIDTAIKKTEKMAGSKQIKIENHVKEKKISAVEDRLTEVFVILFDNAIKYSPKKSRVTVFSQIKNKRISISVTNPGEGISKKDLPHIFDRFYRSDKSRTENGYGLGLSIAKKIVESHSGSITAKSKPGETILVLTLPISS